jgi:DNA-binding transcriptional LysR family regulator
MTDRLTSMAVFVHAVEHGTFRATAKSFRISPTMVGLHVAELEQRVGARLLNRTTRQQSLTDIGRYYYERCKKLLADVDETERAAAQLQGQPRGLLRITAPVTFGVHALAPALHEFLSEHPEVQLELTLEDRVVNIVEAGYDLAIRIGPLPDSNLIARKLGDYRMMVAASPAYLARHGQPRAPGELTNHACLGFAYWDGPGAWRFRSARGELRVPVSGPLTINNGEALRMAALAGTGVILQPELLLAQDVNRGHLRALLPGWHASSRAIHVVHVRDSRRTPKLDRFAAFIRQRFGRPTLRSDATDAAKS